MVHGLSEVFTPMGGNQNESAAAGPVKFFVNVVIADCGLKRINAGVSSDPDFRRILTFAQEIMPGGFRGGKVVISDKVYGLSVEFFRPGGL